MKMCIKLLSAILLIFSGLYSSISLSDSGDELYVGAQLALVTYEEDGFPDLEPTAGVVRFGTTGENGIGFEGRVGIGLAEDDITMSGVNLEFEIDTLFGGYLVAQTQVSGAASVYGILGFSVIDATAKAWFQGDTVSVSDDESGLSYGIGANFGSLGDTQFNMEYMSYLDEDDFTASAISLGILF